jgi:DNA-binding XRE family transcriptional regulator/quercetin dioxygenase-like cupin family protein
MNSHILNKPHCQIGRLLKVFREKLGRNQSEVSSAAGISTSMLSQIERGGVSPSIDTLFDVCGALGLELTELFARLSPRKPVVIHHPGERLHTLRNGVSYEQLALSQSTSHPAELFLLELAVGGEVGMSGEGHEGGEMGYVLEGEAVLCIEDQEYDVRAGDSVTYVSRVAHRLSNRGKARFRAVWSVQPPHRDYLELQVSDTQE